MSEWAIGYGRALRDLEYLARSRGILSPALTELLQTMERDAFVIGHEHDNRQKRKRLAALTEAVPEESSLFAENPEHVLPFITRPPGA